MQDGHVRLWLGSSKCGGPVCVNVGVRYVSMWGSSPCKCGGQVCVNVMVQSVNMGVRAV